MSDVALTWLGHATFRTVEVEGIGFTMTQAHHSGAFGGGDGSITYLGVARCAPCRYGTFPILHGTPGELRELAPDVEILAVEHGGTVAV